MLKKNPALWAGAKRCRKVEPQRRKDRKGSPIKLFFSTPFTSFAPFAAIERQKNNVSVSAGRHPERSEGSGLCVRLGRSFGVPQDDIFTDMTFLTLYNPAFFCATGGLPASVPASR